MNQVLVILSNLREKFKLYLDISKDFFILFIICGVIYGVYYLFTTYKFYTIGGVVVLSVIIFILDVTRVLAFKFDNLFKRINNRFWDAMIRLNQFFNVAWVRYGLGALVLFFLFKSIYYMMGVMP